MPFALQEVENALVELARNRERGEALANAVDAARNAAELARSLRAEREGIEVIFFGRSPVCETENFIGEPFDSLDLVAAARGVLERRADERESARA